MPKITFTKDDLLMKKQLKAGWRKLKVVDITEAQGKNDPESITYPTKFVVDEGEDIGVPINHWFTEKLRGNIIEFFNCFSTTGQVTLNKELEMRDIIGRHVLGYTEYDIKTGFNSIRDFKPVGK